MLDGICRFFYNTQFFELPLAQEISYRYLQNVSS